MRGLSTTTCFSCRQAAAISSCEVCLAAARIICPTSSLPCRMSSTRHRDLFDRTADLRVLLNGGVAPRGGDGGRFPMAPRRSRLHLRRRRGSRDPARGSTRTIRQAHRPMAAPTVTISAAISMCGISKAASISARRRYWLKAMLSFLERWGAGFRAVSITIISSGNSTCVAVRPGPMPPISTADCSSRRCSRPRSSRSIPTTLLAFRARSMPLPGASERIRLPVRRVQGRTLHRASGNDLRGLGAISTVRVSTTTACRSTTVPLSEDGSG